MILHKFDENVRHQSPQNMKYGVTDVTYLKGTPAFKYSSLVLAFCLKLKQKRDIGTALSKEP